MSDFTDPADPWHYVYSAVATDGVSAHAGYLLHLVDVIANEDEVTHVHRTLARAIQAGDEAWRLRLEADRFRLVKS